MKIEMKIVITIVLGIILLFVIDLLSIFILNKPLLAIQTESNDSINKVYKGILYDTYDCNGYINVKSKYAKYTCPSEKVSKLINYDFNVVEDTNTKYQKIFAFRHNNIDYYYGNTNFTLYLTEGNYKYTIEEVITSNKVDIEDILSKSTDNIMFDDGGSEIHRFHNFSIITCNNVLGNNDIIIGNTLLSIGDYCE